jgi:recombination protein RecA
VYLTSGNQVKDKAGNVIGIHVIVTIKKNKLAIPFRKCEFDIIFGKGIVEDEYIFDEVRSYCAPRKGLVNGKVRINISGTGAWKEFQVSDIETGEIIEEKKFYKSDFGALMKDPQYKPYIDAVIEAAYTVVPGDMLNVESEDDVVDENE